MNNKTIKQNNAQEFSALIDKVLLRDRSMIINCINEYDYEYALRDTCGSFVQQAVITDYITIKSLKSFFDMDVTENDIMANRCKYIEMLSDEINNQVKTKFEVSFAEFKI